MIYFLYVIEEMSYEIVVPDWEYPCNLALLSLRDSQDYTISCNPTTWLFIKSLYAQMAVPEFANPFV